MPATGLNYRRIDGMALADLLREPKEAVPMLYGDDEHELSIGDDWHALHFLLTGDIEAGEPPLSEVVLGGFPLVDADRGTGPPRVLTPDRVVAVAEALAAVDVDQLIAAFDRGRFDTLGLHPGDWDRVTPSTVAASARTLQTFFTEVARECDAIVIHLRT